MKQQLKPEMIITLLFITMGWVTTAYGSDDRSSRQLSCLPLNFPCIPNNPLAGQQCCASQGLTCTANPFIPGQYVCALAQCQPLNEPCLPNSVQPIHKCCETDRLSCVVNPVIPSQFKCVNHCLPQNVSCHLRGTPCCHGICERGRQGDMRCPNRVIG